MISLTDTVRAASVALGYKAEASPNGDFSREIMARRRNKLARSQRGARRTASYWTTAMPWLAVVPTSSGSSSGLITAAGSMFAIPDSVLIRIQPTPPPPPPQDFDVPMLPPHPPALTPPVIEILPFETSWIAPPPPPPVPPSDPAPPPPPPPPRSTPILTTPKGVPPVVAPAPIAPAPPAP